MMLEARQRTEPDNVERPPYAITSCWASSFAYFHAPPVSRTPRKPLVLCRKINFRQMMFSETQRA